MSRPTQVLLLLVLVPFTAWWMTGTQDEVQAGWMPLQSAEDAGFLSGQILVDDAVAAENVTLRVEMGAGGGLLARLPVRIDADGSFISPGLPAGLATLVFTVGEIEALRLEDVRVPSTGPSMDPRLPQVDLTVRLQTFSFEIFDGEGEVPEWALLAWRPSDPERGGGPYERFVSAPGGRAVVSVPCAYVDLLVISEGSRLTELEGVASDREIHLQEGWPVRFVLPEGIDPEADGTVVRANLTRVDGEDRLAAGTGRFARLATRIEELPFHDGKAEVCLPSDGTWELEWVVYEPTSDGISKDDLPERIQSFEVGVRTWSEPLQLEFPVDAYRSQRSSER